MCRGSARKSKRRGSAGVRVRWPPVPGGRNGLNCALSDRRLEVSMSHAVAVPVLTIDGPSGSGKGTVSAMVAERLGWHLLDSGALYRAVGFAAGMEGLDLSDAEAVTRCAQTTKISFRDPKDGLETRVIVNGMDATDEIRTETCGAAASAIAAIPGVRAALFDKQRSFRKAPGLVADGRDMGTV